LNLVFIFYTGFTLFIIGLFGVLFFKSITSQIISLQFIIVSSLVNFLSFSQILYESPTSILAFVLLSVFLIIIFQFSIIVYLYSGLNEPKLNRTEFEHSLFYFGIAEWLGEK
jgi:NADH:ubiquinone oxidoreductase subunit K